MPSPNVTADFGQRLQTNDMFGFGTVPASLLVSPEFPAIDELTRLVGKIKPNPKEISLFSRAEIDAGFQCKAPAESIGVPVATPPIEELTAPIPRNNTPCANTGFFVTEIIDTAKIINTNVPIDLLILM
jgi:hypothetical protein